MRTGRASQFFWVAFTSLPFRNLVPRSAGEVCFWPGASSRVKVGLTIGPWRGITYRVSAILRYQDVSVTYRSGLKRIRRLHP